MIFPYIYLWACISEISKLQRNLFLKGTSFFIKTNYGGHVIQFIDEDKKKSKSSFMFSKYMFNFLVLLRFTYKLDECVKSLT